MKAALYNILKLTRGCISVTVLQRGEKLAQCRYGSAQFGDDELLEPVVGGGVDLVALAEVAYSDCDVGHYRFKVRGSRLKVQEKRFKVQEERDKVQEERDKGNAKGLTGQGVWAYC